MRKLRVLFTIQGDGRGHLTQALAVQRILLDAGHEIPAILVGRQPDQDMPEFYVRKAAAPITRYDSFAFITDKTNTKIHALATALHNVRNAGRYWRSMSAIRDAIRRHRPDVVLNFFEPLVGLCYLVHHPAAPLACIANQYLLLHAGYPFPPGKVIDRWLTQFWCRVTSIHAKRRLALSLRPRSNSSAGTAVIPPLLRPEVLACEPGERGRFLLIYLLKAGFRDEIIAWHQRHPEVELHCFTDRPQEADAVPFDETLTFHRISETKFLELMQGCGGMVATGGFQTICEAMYLGKPILIVPVGNHYEQTCNAHEGERIGAGLGAQHFDLDRFVAYLPRHTADVAAVRAWVAEAPRRVLDAIEAAADRQP
jgi:uncharacterized protein (TIGR00661 family)